MPEKHRFCPRPIHRLAWVVLALTAWCFAAAGSGFAAEKTPAPIILRNRIFSFRHIPPEEAKDFLADLRIGDTVSLIPAANALIVTGQPHDLIKATVVLKLIDSTEKFAIKTLPPLPLPEDWPLNEQIAAQVADLEITTFRESPVGTKPRAIVDIHEAAIIAIAPVGQMEKITAAIEQLQEQARLAAARLNSPKSQPTEPNKPRLDIAPEKEPTEDITSLPVPAKEPNEITEPDSTAGDELFDKLLDSLIEAEKTAQKEKQLAAATQPPAPLPAPVVAQAQAVPPAGPAESRPEPTPAPAEPLKPAREPEAAKVQPKEPAAEPEKQTHPAKGVTQDVQLSSVEAPAEMPAAEPFKGLQIPNGEDVLELDLPEKVEIIQLLDLVGKYMNLDYLYDGTKLKGQFVNLKLQGPMRVKDLYALLESVMKFKKFAMTRKGNLVTITPAGEVPNIDPVLTDTIQPGDIVITRVFKLKHIDTNVAKTFLSGMNLGLGTPTTVAETGTLIITEYAFRMPRIESFLKLIDQPGKPKQFKFRQLQHTMAKDLAPKIKTLSEQLGTVSITVAAASARPASPPKKKRGESSSAYKRRMDAFKRQQATAQKGARQATTTIKPGVYLDVDERTNRMLMIGFTEQIALVEKLIDALDVERQDLRTIQEYEIQYVDAAEVVETLKTLGTTTASAKTGRRTPAPAKTPTTSALTTTVPGEEPRIAILEITNSLLVNATAEQHAAIAMVIAYVDREPVEASIPYVIYPLENQDPEELASVLEKLIQRTTQAVAKKGAKVAAKTPITKEEAEITIVPDKKTYSLIVYASKKNQQWIGQLIKQLDEYRPQVLLDVTLVEISKNDEFNLDLNVISSFPDLVNTSGLTGLILGEGEAAIYSAGIIGKLNSSNMDRFIDLQSDKGAGTGFYGDRHINILLTAMQTKGYGRVLARPKLLVNDNEQGTIKAEETTYITRTSITYRKVEEEERPIVDITFDPYQAGIQLDIEPHISKGDQLRLKITMTRTDFRDTPASLRTVDPTPPDKLTSNVTTVVTVPDGKTIILGGLEKIDQSKGGTKVPILGDIPIIGGLFRSTANTDTQSRLYIFVKAHILRPGEELIGESDIEVVSLKNRTTFEKYEEEMQKYEDWPGIKPEPMDPLKILEVD